MCTSEVNTHTWTLDDNLQGSVLSFHRVAPRDQTWVDGLGSQHSQGLRHLTCPRGDFFSPELKLGAIR